MTKSAQINSQIFADQYQEALMDEAMTILMEMDVQEYQAELEASESIIVDCIDWFNATH